MPSRLRVILPLALLFSGSPALAADAPADAALEARITAMGQVGSASGGTYSPDGNQIAYITTLSGSPQAWIIPATGGYPRQVTNGSDPVSGLRWSPDGRLAYAVSPGGGYNAKLFLSSTDGVRVTRMNEGEHNTFAGDFAADGRYYFRSNARDPAATDVWIYDPKTGKSRLAIEMEGLGGLDDLVGQHALVNRLVTRGDNNLWRDDLSTTPQTKILLTPHEGTARSQGQFGADTNTVYLAHDLGRDRAVFGRIRIDDPAIVQTVLTEDRLVAALPAGHPLLAGPVSLRDLAKEPFVLYPGNPRPSYADHVIALFESYGVSIHVAQWTNELQTAIGLVGAGIGITLVPASVQLLHRDDIGFTPLLEDNATSPIILSRRVGDVSPGLNHCLRMIDELLPAKITPM